VVGIVGQGKGEEVGGCRENGEAFVGGVGEWARRG